MDKLTEDLLKIGVPSVLGIISSFFTYRFGKRQQIDTIKIQKSFEHGEKIAETIFEIEELNQSLAASFRANFEYVPTITETMKYFEGPHFFDDMKKDIQTLAQKRADLRAISKKARIYLGGDLLDSVEEYLRVGDFSYDTDGGIFINTYYESFFKNLLDEEREGKRKSFFEKIKKALKSVSSQ